MEMRAYIFGNMYLSSIQQGIQAAHVITDMFVKHKRANKKRKMLHDWATHDKTMVLLNGGTSQDLRYLMNLFEDKNNPKPKRLNSCICIQADLLRV
jgi:peptidyl-tRNA hydrolase